MARQLSGRNGVQTTTEGGGGNANVYITIPFVDVHEFLLIGTQAKITVSASSFDVGIGIAAFDLRIGDTQVKLDAVKQGRQWKAEHILSVTGQSGDRLGIFCTAIDSRGLRSMTGTPAIAPRLTASYIPAPIITSPQSEEYKTTGSITIRGTEFVSLGASDSHRAIHGRVVLADDPQIVRWEGSVAGALTQITAAWTPAGDGQEDLLCSIMYEGVASGKGEWSEPVRIRLIKSGVSVPIITWPLDGERFADPTTLRCNAEQPTIKSGSWTGTEWQVSEFTDFSSLTVTQTFTDTGILPNRVLVDLNLGGLLDRKFYLRCRHLTNIGPTCWSKVITFLTASHQAFWEFTTSGTFNPPVPGVYEVLCVGQGGAGGSSNTNDAGGGGGGSGYLSIGQLFLNIATLYVINQNLTSMSAVVANAGESGMTPDSRNGARGGNGGNGGGGGGGYANNYGGVGGTGASGLSGANGGGGQSTGGAGGSGGGDGAGKSSNTSNVSGSNGYGYGSGMGGGTYSSNVAHGAGGCGAGGYGGGTAFPDNHYYSRHLPYKNFNNVVRTGYIRVMYKGPTGTEFLEVAA